MKQNCTAKYSNIISAISFCTTSFGVLKAIHSQQAMIPLGPTKKTMHSIKHKCCFTVAVEKENKTPISESTPVWTKQGGHEVNMSLNLFCPPMAQLEVHHHSMRDEYEEILLRQDAACNEEQPLTICFKVKSHFLNCFASTGNRSVTCFISSFFYLAAVTLSSMCAEAALCMLQEQQIPLLDPHCQYDLSKIGRLV